MPYMNTTGNAKEKINGMQNIVLQPQRECRFRKSKCRGHHEVVQFVPESREAVFESGGTC